MKTTQFHKCHAYITRINERFDVVTSYATDVMIVDHVTHECIQGACARGFSQTTSRQVSRILYEMYCGYNVVSYKSHRYYEFLQEWDVPEHWCKYNHSCNFWRSLGSKIK